MSKRVARFFLGLIGITSLFAGIYLAFASLLQEPALVSFGSELYEPTPSVVCPGDMITYPVELSIAYHGEEYVIQIIEAWYSVDKHTLLQSTAKTVNLPVVRDFNMQSITLERVPENLKPGNYELHSVTINGQGEGYRVGPVIVVECSE